MSEDFVYIPVPKEWSGAIYQRLSELAGQLDPPSVRRERDRPGTLAPELVRRMFVESHPRHRNLMQFLAEHQDRWFSTAELAEPLGLTKAREVAGTLGAFARRANHRYAGALPWESVWSIDDEIARHRMPAAVAAVVREVAASADAAATPA